VLAYVLLWNVFNIILNVTYNKIFYVFLRLCIYTYINLNNSIIFSMTYTNRCIYSVVPPDDEQLGCSKHVEINY
jgi:hypothetical protein